MQSEPGSSSIEEILKIISAAQAKDDPFAILGITPDATEQEIRRSFRYFIFGYLHLCLFCSFGTVVQSDRYIFFRYL
jgi:hypothetical protein